MKRPAIGFSLVKGELGEDVSLYCKFQWDGQPARPPKKGERYLSGAIVTAYLAKADLTASYFIAVPAQKDPT